MSAPVRRGPQPAAAIFAWPAAVAAASAVGLVSALIGDGAWDLLSWLLLGGVAALMIVRLAR